MGERWKINIFNIFTCIIGTIHFPSGGGGTSSIVVNTQLARTYFGEKALATQDC